MHKQTKVACSYCKKQFLKATYRVKESKKRGWKLFCTKNCELSHKKTGYMLTCSRPGCNKTFWRFKNQFAKCAQHYCSRTCAVAVNNAIYPKRKAVIKICPICNKSFKTLEKYCSLRCKHSSQLISSDKLLMLIIMFYQKNGRIPLKREFHHYSAIRGRFGTWNNAIKKAGYEPNPVMFAKKHIAFDGHKCDSLAEKIIDDWLFARNIEHTRSVHYPGKNCFTADFVVKDYWIEFFGLSGQLKRYDELKAKKIRLIKKYHIPFIALYPKDLFPQSNLDSLLSLVV